MEGVQDRKSSFFQPQSRSCTELHKHLTSAAAAAAATTNAHCPRTKCSWPTEECHSSRNSNEPQGQYAHNGEDSDSSEDLPNFSNVAATPPSSSSEEGSGEKELHAAVELIRYMHTYCLPPRKLPPTGLADVKHQHYHSPSKRAMPDCSLQRPLLCGRDTCSSSSWRASAGCKRSRASSSDFSILKELLARDLPCDVSKPYRLAKPVYASLARSQPLKSPRLPPLETGRAAETSTSTAKMPPKEKTGPRQSAPTEPEAKKETGSPAEEDGAKQGTFSAQLASGKMVRKQESSVYAVRRSKRLNPELSLWLSFLEESPSDPAISTEAAEDRAKEPFPSTAPLESFDAEAPAAEVEVSGVDEAESECQSHPMELQTPSPESAEESEVYEINEISCCTLLHRTGMEASRLVAAPYVSIPTVGNSRCGKACRR